MTRSKSLAGERLQNDTATRRVACDLDCVAKPELLQDVYSMRLNRGDTDRQHVCDLLAASPLGY